MEKTPLDQQTKIESNKLTGSQDFGISSCTSTHISSSNNSGTKTLIEYDIDKPSDINKETGQDEDAHWKGKNNPLSGKNQLDEKCATTEVSSDNSSGAITLIEYEIDKSLDIKEEIIQEQERHQSETHNLRTERNLLDEKYTTTEISSNNYSGAMTLVEYDFDETLKIKEEIIQDQQNKSESNKSAGKQDAGPSSCTTTNISSGNNSNAKTLIKCDIDETLDIKEEIVQDQERQQWEKQNIRSEINQLDEKCITTEISSDNNSRANTLIEYDYDETLEIKEETAQDHQNIGERRSIKYESKWCISDTREADIMTVKELRTSKKNIQESKSKPKKKYNCERCARSYVQKENLYKHKKFECDVMPQFRCEFCGKRFKQKCHMNRHILGMHQKTDSKASQTRHNCDKCSRNYRSASALNEHERVEHAAVRPQFICDCCGFQTNRKSTLSKHINLRHMQKIQVSITQPEKRYKCEKCARVYVRIGSLHTHQRYECYVIPQFSCEFCGKSFKLKGVMKKHILRMHQKRDSNTSQMSHNCQKCSRNYNSENALYQHKRLEHTTLVPQFICDFCGFETKRKDSLPKHINSKHLSL